MDIYRPQGKEEARRMHKIKRMMHEMDWFPYRELPRRIQRLLVLPRLANLDRLNLCIFLRFNGLDLRYCYDLIEFERSFDGAATQQIRHLLTKDVSTYSCIYWDMRAQAYFNMKGKQVNIHQ